MNLLNTTAPIGSIVALAGNTNTQQIEASGWLVCDGRILEAREYPELFAALQYTFGGANNAFNIPDYSGLSLQSKGSSGGSRYIIKFTSRTPN